jgi:hypothetical protein
VNREIPQDPHTLAFIAGAAPTVFAPKPTTTLEALMVCPPGVTPQKAAREALDLRDVIEDAVQDLEPIEAWIFNETMVARRSLRAFGIPKTTVARIRDRAIRKLRETLETDPIVQTYLEKDMEDTP